MPLIYIRDQRGKTYRSAALRPLSRLVELNDKQQQAAVGTWEDEGGMTVATPGMDRPVKRAQDADGSRQIESKAASH